MQVSSPIQLILFIDDRPSSFEVVKAVEEFLQGCPPESAELQVIDVTGQPYLAEHFRVVLTPALLKIYPAPRQTIAGKSLMVQLRNSWHSWQLALQNLQSNNIDRKNQIDRSAEIIKMTDEVFRLTQEKNYLQQQLHFKDRIIAMLAHDLRNPITAISLALETLDNSGEKLDPEQREQVLLHARKQVRTADNMITEILESGRGEVFHFPIHPQRTNISEVCRRVVEDYYLLHKLKEKQQDLVTDIPNDLPYVYADGERVQQVLANLMDNAIKYTPVGGKIQVTALHRTSQKVEITVTDTGPGVPAELREKIFEEQFRLSRDQQTEGYGIGLAVCKRIIRAHYGKIWVDSPPKGGSSFHVTLPVY
ncbi:MAG: histidine kinase [Pseudanabaenaceae cyanobacterium SKYGB_i_bin29]|nr:histidine kinase [Pseudanabaenaceae cyanobacterium SKYG29]MDW8422348.1 histidine kinase [Pseudanabaenaceae cyanobacterium SKYGB_i_bin29]